MSTLFCFGLGYSAQVLAAKLKAKGWGVVGTTREMNKAADLAAQDYDLHLFDGTAPLADASVMAPATHLLISVPADDDTDPVLRWHAADIAKLQHLKWLGYLSTTGVYGDRGGDWVDESSDLRPSQARSKRRAEAEAAWLALWREHSVPVHVFRLAGIYGPGRSQLESLRRGTAKRLVKPGQVFCRIHVEDIAQVLQASIARPDPGAIYNVADDEPAPPQDVVAYAAKLLGMAPPPEEPFDAAKLTPMAASFYADNRRVRNDRIKRELGVTLKYPTYREGLRAMAAPLAAQLQDRA
ncbi:MAG TPA: SDR family oxidoreductase [Ferrovibrio sp.]|uniref:SDR family oxidoreductase n=1 Tax=Ferrovibrio sp. TaxID=1917215 RepID=UPI002B4B836F|nr:SDR family oxidoreductase [Ferrovibrio sp.]HLT77925.1 SDR family oxidoreductase [Ferrovibrio sp.]